MTFREDANRVQQRTEAANCSLRRKMALSMLKRNPSKHSIDGKQRMAALDPVFLAGILIGSQKLEKA